MSRNGKTMTVSAEQALGWIKLAVEQGQSREALTLINDLIDALRGHWDTWSEQRQTAVDLVRKLEEIHAHPGFKAVWVCAQVHGEPYTGPNYKDELFALRSALGLPEDPSYATTVTVRIVP